MNHIVDAIAKAVDEFAHEINWDENKHITSASWNMENAINYSLIRAYRCKKIYEVGPYCGYTTRFLGRAATFNQTRVVSIERAKDCYRMTLSASAHLPIDVMHQDAESYSFPDNIDFFLYDGDHDKHSVDFYKEKIYPKITGWFAVHDIDMSDSPSAESIEFKKVFDGDFVTTRQVMERTKFRPPFEFPENNWALSMVYIYRGDNGQTKL